MKKLLALVLCVLLIGVLALTTLAAEDTKITVTPETSSLYPGEEVTLTVSVSASQTWTSMGYIPLFNSPAFQVVRGKVLTGFTGPLSEFSLTDGGMVMVDPTTSGDVFQFTIRVREDAAVGTYPVTDAANITINDFEIIDAEITVLCRHEYGAWTETGDGHTQTCGKCGDIQKEAHTWKEEVVKEATCKEEGKLKLTCEACKAVDPNGKKIPVAKTHRFGKWTRTVSGEYSHKCMDCGAREILDYTVQDSGVTVTGYTGNCAVVEIPVAIEGKLVTAIAAQAFVGCADMTEVYIPNTLTLIEDNAFADCTALADVYYAGTADQWQKLNLRGNAALANAALHSEAKGTTQVMLVPQKQQVNRGELLEFLVSVVGDYEWSSMGCIPEFDSSVFQIVEGEVLPGFTGPMSEFDLVEGGVVMIDPATSGNVFKFVVKVSDDAAFAEYSYSAEVSVNHGADAVAHALCIYNIEVVCDHSTAVYEKVDEENHTRDCDICETFVTLPHDYVDGRCVDCGDYQYWNYTISTDNKVTITRYTGPGGEVQILDLIEDLEVVAIAEGAFADCSEITALSIPTSIKIFENAFTGCTGLNRVNISDLDAWMAIDFANAECNPLSIAHNLYLNGSKVTEVKLSGDVGKYVFAGCTDLKSVVISEDIGQIGENAFDGCDAISNVYCEGNSDHWEQWAGKDNEALANADVYFNIDEAVSGNFDGSEEIDDGDAMYLLRFTLFPQRYPVEAPADVNNDGATSDADAMYLLRFTLFPERFPLYPDSILSELYTKN